MKTNLGKGGNYKPRLRGAGFTARIKAKKSNDLRSRERMQAKITAERAGNNVSAYGGLGAHGLDFGADGGDASKASQKENEASFSGSAMCYAPKVIVDDDFDEESQGKDDLNMEDTDKIINKSDSQNK